VTVEQMRLLLGLGPEVSDADVIAAYAAYLAANPPQYVDPTPADVKMDFAVFADVPDAAVQRRIDRTASWVDQSWMAGDFTWAKELLTAHFLTEDGLGAGTGAEMNALGLSGVSRLKSGTLDVTFSAASDGGGAGDSPLLSTSYGRRFYALLRKNRGGVVSVSGGGCGIADQATDTPWAWRTAGWGL
jgi:hypothetical protein